MKKKKDHLAVKTYQHYYMQCNARSYYCLDCLHYFIAENEPKSHEKVCKIKDLCGIVMLSEKHNILEFNHYVKSGK